MSCFGGLDEQIYLIEVFVDKLKLTEGKIKDVGEYPVAIKIKFLEFPVIEITREDFDSIKPAQPADDGTLHFSMGRSCLFIKRPIDLVRDLRSSPVKVAVYRAGDTYPTAETELTVPGCLCDQISMSTNDRKNLPKPFSMKGGFHLLDPGENYAGTLDMELRLSSFGRSILTHYEMRPKFFLFKNEDEEQEYAVRRLIPVRYCDAKEGEDVLKCGEGTLPEFFDESEKVQVQADAKPKDGKGVKKRKGKQKKKGKKGGKKKGKK